MNWEELEKNCKACNRCALAAGRRKVVIGRGSKTADILFVGEGPGENEDKQGLPFVGQAGELLDLALNSIGFDKNDYYIANIVKCRPPQNRNPEPEECNACLPFLRAQFSLIRPKIIVALGSIASNYLVEKDLRITKSRGIWVEKQGVLFMPTYHPAALLRDPSKKIDMWEDLLKVYEKLKELRAR